MLIILSINLIKTLKVALLKKKVVLVNCIIILLNR